MQRGPWVDAAVGTFAPVSASRGGARWTCDSEADASVQARESDG
jgi:hypothetical protein